MGEGYLYAAGENSEGDIEGSMGKRLDDWFDLYLDGNSRAKRGELFGEIVSLI